MGSSQGGVHHRRPPRHGRLKLWLPLHTDGASAAGSLPASPSPLPSPSLTSVPHEHTWVSPCSRSLAHRCAARCCCGASPRGAGSSAAQVCAPGAHTLPPSRPDGVRQNSREKMQRLGSCWSPGRLESWRPLVPGYGIMPTTLWPAPAVRLWSVVSCRAGFVPCLESMQSWLELAWRQGQAPPACCKTRSFEPLQSRTDVLNWLSG